MPVPETATLLQRAFDPSVETADDAISQRILNAALELAAASGLKNLTMDDVARKARVGRMTVYRRFGSRENLIDALAVREARRCLAAIATAPDPLDPIEDRLADLFVATLTVIREHPLLARLARVEPEAIVAELTRDDSAVFRLVREFLIATIRQGQAEQEVLAELDPVLVAELGVRLGASFVLIPDSALPLGDERATRRIARGLIAQLALPRH
jgi:AcrR family transcriptional regulator